MSSTGADDGSTIAPPSRSAVRREVQSMARMIKKEWVDITMTIVAVVRPESMDRLRPKCRTSWWMLGTRKPPFITTEDQLNDTIETARVEQRCRKMLILVSSHINAISFAVDGYIKSLIVCRCICSRDDRGQLLISGTSVFDNVCLDSWAEEPRRRRLYLGERVIIQPRFDSWVQAMGTNANVPSFEKQTLNSHLQKMKDADPGGEWWHQWKGPVASILGVIFSAGKFAVALDAAAGGILVEYKLGLASLNIAAGAVKASTLVTAAGPAVLIGVGVAAAVYFVPWDDIFSWMKGIFWRIWSWICSWWEKFRQTVQARSSNGSNQNNRHRGVVPIKSS